MNISDKVFRLPWHGHRHVSR